MSPRLCYAWSEMRRRHGAAIAGGASLVGVTGTWLPFVSRGQGSGNAGQKIGDKMRGQGMDYHTRVVQGKSGDSNEESNQSAPNHNSHMGGTGDRGWRTQGNGIGYLSHMRCARKERFERGQLWLTSSWSECTNSRKWGNFRAAYSIFQRG